MSDAKDLAEILGKELRVVKLADGTVVSRWFECEACSGAGAHEIFYNEDDSYTEECRGCDGKGEIEVF